MEQEEIVKVITVLEGSVKTAYRRIDGLEAEVKEIRSEQKILHEMNKNIAVLAANYEMQGEKIKAIESDFKDLKNDVKELKDKPAKRWDILTTAILTSLVSGIAGFILAKVLGG